MTLDRHDVALSEDSQRQKFLMFCYPAIESEQETLEEEI